MIDFRQPRRPSATRPPAETLEALQVLADVQRLYATLPSHPTGDRRAVMAEIHALGVRYRTLVPDSDVTVLQPGYSSKR